MITRKFLSEFGLNMISGYRFLLQQQHLDSINSTGVDPHIYLIGKRPKISINPSSFKITQDSITIEFRKQIKDTYISIPVTAPNRLGIAEVSLECEYPYTDFRFIDGTGKSVAGGSSALILSTLGSQFFEHTDIEILYIGQSYGKHGSRNAADRLKKHETLQGIYSEAIKNSPDCDIWLILCTFEPILVSSFDGRNPYSVTIDEDTDHMKKVLESEITEQQQINFTEAALIRYFQPQYTVIYKDSFPNPAHSTYSECYDLDLNMVSAEIQTDDLMVRLWSHAAEPNWVHLCSFPLHSREDRVYMFDLDYLS